MSILIPPTAPEQIQLIFDISSLFEIYSRCHCPSGYCNFSKDLETNVSQGKVSKFVVWM